MRSSAVQMACGALGVIGLFGVIGCCAIPRWRRMVFKTVNVVAPMESHEGLWMACVKSVITGQPQCKAYDSKLELSSDLQAARAMTVISCTLGGISLLFLFFGADFTKCVQNKDAKPKIIVVAALGLLSTGLLVIIPVSWVAHITERDFHKQFVPEAIQSETGECIYIGWAAGVLMILAGGLLCCFTRPNPATPEEPYDLLRLVSNR